MTGPIKERGTYAGTAADNSSGTVTSTTMRSLVKEKVSSRISTAPNAVLKYSTARGMMRKKRNDLYSSNDMVII